MKKIRIFVDVQNIYYTCRQAYQRNFDYNTFWAQVTRNRERLFRYIARPAVAIPRLFLSSTSKMVYTLKTPYRDGAIDQGADCCAGSFRNERGCSCA